MVSVGASGDTVSITHDGTPVTATASGYRLVNSLSGACDVYETEPGDIITITRPETKGDVKAGYQYNGDAVRKDGTIVDLSTSTFPIEYTVTEDDVLVSFYYRY